MWQHFVAARSASCNLTLADRIMTATQLDQLLPAVFEARASCADAAVNLAGIPYDFLAAAVFVACAVAAIGVLRRAALRRPARLDGALQSSIGVLSATSSEIASSKASIAVSE